MIDFKVKCGFCGKEMDGMFGSKLTNGLYYVSCVSCTCPNDSYNEYPVYDSICDLSYMNKNDFKDLNYVFYLRENKDYKCRSFKKFYKDKTYLYPLSNILKAYRLIGGKWRGKLAFPTDRYLVGDLSHVLPNNPKSKELPKNIRMTVSGKNHLNKLKECRI